MDNLQCGQCGSIFHKLERFIEHKQQNCAKVGQKPSTSLTPARKIVRIGPKRYKHLNRSQVVCPEKDDYPLEYKDISSFIVKKNIFKDEGFDYKYEKLYLRRKLLAALPKGYCGECPACLRSKNCGECSSCLERDTMVGPQSRKRCLLRVCDTISAKRVFHVECIIDKRVQNDELQYLVKWKGYPSSENSWEPVANILSKVLIEEYEGLTTLQKRRADEDFSLPAKRVKLTEMESEEMILSNDNSSTLLGKPELIKPADAEEKISEILNQNDDVDSFINMEATVTSVVEPITEGQTETGNSMITEGQTETENIIITEGQVETENSMITEGPTETGNSIITEGQVETENSIITDDVNKEKLYNEQQNEEIPVPEPQPILAENPNLLEIKQFLQLGYLDELAANGEGSEKKQAETKVVSPETSESLMNTPLQREVVKAPIQKPKRGARKSMKSMVTRMTRREIEAILEDLKRDAIKNEVAPETGEITGVELEESSSNSVDGPIARAGRTTKLAAMNLIRSVCNKPGACRLEIEDDSDSDSSLSRQGKHVNFDVKPTDSYETNLDLSEAATVAYFPLSGEQGKFVFVKGNQEQMTVLEGANLNPVVCIDSKETLRKATPIATAEDILQMEQEEEQRRFERELAAEFFADTPEDYFSDNYFNIEDEIEYNSEKRFIKPVKREFVDKRPVQTAPKKKPGRPKKSEQAKKEPVVAEKVPPPEPVVPEEDQGIVGLVTRRRSGKPKKYLEYIDPDILLEDADKEASEPDKTWTPKDDTGPEDDDDFKPKIPGKSSGRPRGRPPKHYNINDITDENDFRRKFSKSSSTKTADGAGKAKSGKKNRVFVVMPDGTMVEVSGNDKEKAIARASAKMDVIRKNVPKTEVEDPKRSDLRPLLEECTTDMDNDTTTLKLPNTVQLVESELPLSEAENSEALVGMYLFRQIYSPNDTNLSCRLCKGKVAIRYPVDLEKHYHIIHEINVQIFKAEFSESIVFVCVPSDVSEDTVLNSGCRFCDVTLKTLSEVREHYPADHNKDVRLVPETAVMELSDSFYCSICSHPSLDFALHHQHMKSEHKMQTYTCKFCNFCTPRTGRLRTHVKQRHMQEQPGPNLQCSVCSVFVHGRERLNKHILLSHAVQTGPKTWSCAKCLQPCGDARSLMAHINECPYLKGDVTPVLVDSSASKTESKSDETAVSLNLEGGKKNLFYKCNDCSMMFSSEDEIKKHMEEENHTMTEVAVLMQDSAEPTEEISCFLCNMAFLSEEQCIQHLHHIHMRWVAKGVHDYSAEELQELPDELAKLGVENGTKDNEYLLDPETGLKVRPGALGLEPSPEVSKSEQELIKQLENELMEGLTEEPAKSYGNANKKESVVITGDSSLSALQMKDLPNDAKLTELGFPTKVGHYCHLCDAVIKSYTLFYLHMHNLHGLEKRFQCMLSYCSHTFKSRVAFRQHCLTHDQKSEHFCSMCDSIFSDSEDLQEHMLSPEHATKYMKIQEKYNRSEPRNYRCKVCHSWFGLFVTFVKHMETESHQYQCQHCSLLFVQPGPRRNHIQSVHPELANICEICGARLQNSQALWSHLSLHSIVYECEKCHRRFLQKEQLTAHMEIHAPPTPCPWEGCTRKLSTKVGLYNHLRMHRGETDFKCDICNKGFFKKKALETHLKTHEVKPFVQKKARPTPAQGPTLPTQAKDLTLLQSDNSLGPQLAATNVEMIQLICAGCLNGFDSEDKFSEHICTGHALSDQHDTSSNISQDHILGNNSEQPTQTFTLADSETHQIITDEDLAAQLAQAVAEATAPGVTVSFTTTQTVTMSDGTVLTLAAGDDDATTMVVNESEMPVTPADQEATDNLMIADESNNEDETKHLVANEGLIDNNDSSVTNIQEHSQEAEQVEGEENNPEQYAPEGFVSLQDGTQMHAAQEEDDEQQQQAIAMEEEEGNMEAVEGETQTLFLTEEEALLAAQSGQLRDNGDGTLFMHQAEGAEGEEGIVMMVDEDGNEQQIITDGNQPYTVMKVPTADGGEQVLLIPLNTEGGNTVLTLPPNMVLSEDGDMNGMTVSFQTEGEEGSSEGQTLLTLAEGETMEGLLSTEESAEQGEEVLMQEELLNS